MNTITIGLDIAKSVFQVHGEAAGSVVLQKRLRRSQIVEFFAKLPRSLIGIEACGSAHYWARTLRDLGHEVRLLPAAYVKPFVRRNKTDARDAAAICTALGRPDMRFVAVKSVEQQAARALERSRDLLAVRRRLSPFPTRHRCGGPIASGRINSSVSQRARSRSRRRQNGQDLDWNTPSRHRAAKRVAMLGAQSA